MTKGKDGDAGMISLVRALLAGGDVDRAVTFLDQRLVENPQDVTALVLRASILSGRGELELAEERRRKRMAREEGERQRAEEEKRRQEAQELEAVGPRRPGKNQRECSRESDLPNRDTVCHE